IVVDDHLPVAADQGAAHLHRRQPVDMVVGEQVVREEAGQVRHVDGLPGNVRGSGGGHGTGLLAEDVVHDGEIVDGQVPQHVDVVLKETEVHPHGVVVVKPSEVAAVDQL